MTQSPKHDMISAEILGEAIASEPVDTVKRLLTDDNVDSVAKEHMVYILGSPDRWNARQVVEVFAKAGATVEMRDVQNYRRRNHISAMNKGA